MTMICGLDLHRRQITFDALEVKSRSGMDRPGVATLRGPTSPITSGSGIKPLVGDVVIGRLASIIVPAFADTARRDIRAR